MTAYHQSLERLQNIMNELREQCPWDKKQTIDSLRPQTIEELYELTDAITDHNWKGMQEELGDLLLHIVFYSKIAQEQKEFSLADVIENLCNKLVSRHPHIYDSLEINNEEDVKKNWEKLKLKEGKKSVLSGVPPSLPAIIKALRLQEKAKQIGFEWDNKEQVLDKVNEEMDELQEALLQKTHKEVEEEFGDVLFSLVNYARFLGVDPENALEKTNKKFKHRFEAMEKLASDSNQSLDKMTLQEMDALWDKVKQ